jgi:hypothetical protein
MESNFNRREFERFIQDNADQYRMFPSEKVWKNVHNALHTRRKWYGIGLFALLLSTVTAVTAVMMSYPVPKRSVIVAPIMREKAQVPITSAEEVQQVISFDQSEPKQQKPGIAESSSNNFLTGSEIAETAVSSRLSSSQQKIRMLEDNTTQLVPSAASVPENKFSIAQPTIVTATDKQVINEPVAKTQTHTPVENAWPFTIESVVNAYQVKRTGKRLIWELSFSPTISYRKLSENKFYQGSAFISPGSYPFSALGNEDVNNAVTHKPDMGFEIGLTAKYPVTKKVNLRTGLQFNIRRYDIKAFAYRGEMANIDLTGAAGSTTTWTYYRTRNGYKADWLKNFYLTVSVPLGAELMLFGNKTTSVGIAGTLQPTYIISDRAYLISTDYKNYAEVPSLIRHVNLNTSFETFVSHKGRKTQWQIGPQVRYQVLSSFQNKYPVKENLFDFGLRMGITLNNQ